MRLLALDTSSDACSVALQLGDDVAENHVLGAREHTRILVPMIRNLLDEAGVALGDLDAIVLGNGPGSFIGMRIGASVAQGLAHGAALDIVPVSSLLAVAAAALETCTEDTVVVAQDARMSEVYWGEYCRAGRGVPELAEEERIVAAGFAWQGAGAFIAAGSGWDRYPSLMAANQASVASQSPEKNPRARHLLTPGAVLLSRGDAVRPEQLAPAYLRSKVAEVPGARE
jgi:tRNA threonylcarbamoyladenosine biosynthesis protein TsaB